MRRFVLYLAVVVVLFGVMGQGKAISDEYVINGGFETGDFTGWVSDANGEAWWTINDGTYFVPWLNYGTIPPISQSYDALADQAGPSDSALFQQSITLPSGIISATLSWSDRILNWFQVYVEQQQEFKVMIRVGLDEYEIFSTAPGDAYWQFGPTYRSFDVTTLVQSLEGQDMEVVFSLETGLGPCTVAFDDVSLDIIANRPPVADANGPYNVLATSWDGAWVILDGSESSDPDGDDLDYIWDIGSAEPVVGHQFPIGQTDVTLTVFDGELEDSVTVTVTVSIVEVEIDIKPGSDPNSINLGSNGVVPVAFLTTPDFDAADPDMGVDPYTVTLAGKDFSGLVKLRGKKQQPMANVEDVDGDGDLDLVVHLLTENLTLESKAVTCVIGALTYDGWVVQGEDSVRIVPDK